MKSNARIFIALALSAVIIAAPAAVFAQDKPAAKTADAATPTAQQPPAAAPSQTPAPQSSPAAASRPKRVQDDRLEPDDTRAVPADVPPEAQANRREQLSEEEAAVVPYYNNFMASYRLGPEDVISIRVFDQPRYSMAGVTIPPNGRVSYWFVPDGLMVTGKTTEQVASEVVRHLEEYILEPRVTVTLERAMSARYSVVGDVAQPGIRVMTRRLTVYEALSEAGGILNTGSKKKVVVIRQQADGSLKQIPVNIEEIEKGRALNNQFLAPGDQVLVPGNRFKTIQKVMTLLPVLGFARIFTGGW
ncbi:MAG TPA: polysaccharide biosynthesis/export family protein [Pyrinomonadaceae bacterium]|nr:polysaccharide biosynthesis/export family protein [Pyrinomonadaceae bacterium]